MRWILLLGLTACAPPPPPPKPPPPPPEVHAIEVKVEQTNLTTGDEIVITSLHGDRTGCVAGGNYQISGRYVLGSRGNAELVVSSHGGQTSPMEKTVARGVGEFTFNFEIIKDGALEVMFLKAGGGSSRGGITVSCVSPP